MRRNKKTIVIIVTIAAIVILGVAGGATAWLLLQKDKTIPPEQVLTQYMELIQEQKYTEMYDFLNQTSQQSITREEFVDRHQKIYDGIEAANLEVTITEVDKQDTVRVVHYQTTMDTVAGLLQFDNSASLTLSGEGKDEQYKLAWDHPLILPDLEFTDRVRVSVVPAKRGNILDRNGDFLAKQGTAANVGIVPGKLDDRDVSIQKVADLLEMSVESIEKKLSASYVKDDTFVEIKVIPEKSQDLIDQLLTVPGIKISDTEVRFYPYGEEASHLTGYVQNITAEELEKLKEDTSFSYTANSQIGKSGLESIFEERLRAKDGHKISILDQDGEVKKVLAETEAENGENIKLTIDMNLQDQIYSQLKEDSGCAVAMNPKTGEVFALVSTPAYDPNDFVLGMSNTKWEELKDREDKPMFNRYKSTLCPGSIFKSVTAAIGLNAGKIDPDADLGHSGLTWKKDDSWGDYYITTTQEYAGAANLENALIYSDNIYFGKSALGMGSSVFEEQLKKIGFGESLPFVFELTASQFSNDNTPITSDIQLADSGYGQGQVLVNPLHMASIYSAFVNQGSMIAPQLELKQNSAPSFWKQNAFSPETAETVKNDLIQVIENPNGTGAEAKIAGKTLLGKTGTAEIKKSKDDTTGTELGWFVASTADDSENPLLIVEMVEDVKDRGGSHYVVPKVKSAFEFFGQ